MKIQTLLDGVSANGAGSAISIDGFRLVDGAIPVQIHGGGSAFSATVKLEATIATDDEVSGGTCEWSPIANASWTEETCTSLFAAFTHIRAIVSGYSSGTITVVALI